MSERNYDFVDNAKEELVAADQRIDEPQYELDAAFSKVPRWISVKERLPPLDEDVLVVCGEDAWIGSLDADGDWWGLGLFDKLPTHWMPLPEPPELKK